MNKNVEELGTVRKGKRERKGSERRQRKRGKGEFKRK